MSTDDSRLQSSLLSCDDPSSLPESVSRRRRSSALRWRCDAREGLDAQRWDAAAAAPLDLLVLGGTGFIGPHLVRHARRAWPPRHDLHCAAAATPTSPPASSD